MNIRPGDRVKFTDEPGGGIVTRIDPKGWVWVETDDGFEIPATPDKLIRSGTTVIETEYQENTPNRPEDTAGMDPEPQQQKDTTPTPEDEEHPLTDDTPPVGEEDPVIFLALAPAGERLLCFLVNDSAYQLSYAAGLTEGNRSRMLGSGILEEDTKIELGEVTLQKGRVLFLQAILTSGHSFRPRPPLDSQVVLEPDQLTDSDLFRENPYLDTDAWLIPLLPQKIKVQLPEPKAILREKQDRPVSKHMHRPSISGHEPIEEVDLHIESITDDHIKYSPGEIMEMQLARFETALEGARHSGQKRIVFIHGLGQGKLKFEIRKILDQRKIRYQDASFKEYGYGATMVILR